ncbi:hypothetical protein UFOVP1365_30 [uncultured Caudovirales phage]|uniref:Uncharacterized protein n=1 Tax=uncultured Caudovirales phage TaxID=2100421 RepID=A0A6J5S034_9CAUD|nr:hypothetical protein UFOVP1365_30 [uncultured Caudovirales phage]
MLKIPEYIEDEETFGCQIKAHHLEQLSESNDYSKQILEHAKYLKNLEKLSILDDIKEHLLEAATGKNHMETKTALKIFLVGSAIFGGVIASMVGIIAFLLTGSHAGYIQPLH